MNADLLLYRRMRGMFWGGLVAVTIAVPTLILLGIGITATIATLSAHDIHQLGGPTDFFRGGLATLTLAGSVVALLIGATAGSVDAQRGVLRDLVLTGRPRVVIALRRIVAAIVWIAVAVAITLAAVTLIAVTLAPDTSTSMNWSVWGRDALTLIPQILEALLMGAGLALLIGTRGPAVIVYFVVTLFVDNILNNIPKVDDVWHHISLTRAEQHVIHGISPSLGAPFDSSSLTTAWIVFVAWAVVPLIAGLVRLQKRDL